MLSKCVNDPPLRVAHLISGLGRGGAETSLLRLILDTRGIVQHHVIGMTRGDALASAMQQAGARVTVLGSARAVPNPCLLWNATSALLDEGPDIVHTWMWHAAALWSICRINPRLRQIPCIWGFRSSLDSGARPLPIRISVAIARASSGYPSAIVYNSNSSFSEHARAGFCMQNASVSHNGVDIPDEALIAEWRRAIRAQIGAGDGVIVYVHLGRAHPDKGIDDFVKAAKLVHAQLGSRAVFVRVGRPGWINGQSLESCALERSTLLYHAGEQPESRPWLAAADVCVMTSVRESCPNVVLESMSAGTPVVATDVGDAALIVGECGWIVQPNSPQAIANAMITAASTIAQPHHRARLWTECRMAMSDRYCRQRVADRQVAIYRDVVRSSIGALST